MKRLRHAIFYATNRRAGLMALLALLLLVWAVPSCQSKKPAVSLAAGGEDDVFTSIDLRDRLREAGDAAVAWKVARRLDAFSALHNFLLLYPEGEPAMRARQELGRHEEALWQEVLWALRTGAPVKDYLLMTYLDLFPEGKYGEEARRLYDALPDRERLYTLEFNDRARAAVLFDREDDPSFDLDAIRLRGLADYLRERPTSPLADWITEKLVRTYISARYLPLLPAAAGRLIPITPPELAQLQDGLEQLPGLTPAQRTRADAYLRDIILRTGALTLLDDNNDSILDGLEIDETLRLQPDRVEFPEKMDGLEELETSDLPGVSRPSPPEQVKVRPPDLELLPDRNKQTTPDRSEQIPAISIEALAEEEAGRIGRGSFEYDSIPVLTVDSPYLFQLVIVPGPDSLLPPAGAKTVRRPIDVSSEMAVRIIPADPVAFDIRALTDTIQPVGGAGGTNWSWYITPRLAGRHQVVITIDIFTRGQFVEKPLRKSITVATETIEVIARHAGPPPPEPDSFALPFSPYWFLVLLLPLFLLLFFTWRGRRRRRASILLSEGSDDPLIEAIEEERAILRDERDELLPGLDRAEQAIAAGDTDKALDILLERFRGGRHDAIYGELLSLSAQYRQYQRSFNLGLRPDASIPNRVNLALIQLLTYIRNVVTDRKGPEGERRSDAEGGG